MRYYIIAGEASGDMHGAALIEGLISCDPQAEIRFRGGPLMERAAQGARCWEKASDYRDKAVMGIVEVASKLCSIVHDIGACKRDIEGWNPDLLILIDYPGFNLRMARFARRKGIRVCYYIAPKVWAHGEGRLRRLRRDIDMLYVIFPFEVEYFARHGIAARYFGNPLSDMIPPAETAAETPPVSRPPAASAEGGTEITAPAYPATEADVEERTIAQSGQITHPEALPETEAPREGITIAQGERIPHTEALPETEAPGESRMIALLPGSRKGELDYLMPRFAALEALMKIDEATSPWHGWRLVIPAAPNISEAALRSYLPAGSRIEIRTGETYRVLREAHSALVSSGTASLETALIGTPQAVCYGLNPITYLIGRLIIKVPYISLANLILGKEVFRELIQKGASPEKMEAELRRITFDPGCRTAMEADYAKLRAMLSAEGGVARRIAHDIAAPLKPEGGEGDRNI